MREKEETENKDVCYPVGDVNSNNLKTMTSHSDSIPE